MPVHSPVRRRTTLALLSLTGWPVLQGTARSAEESEEAIERLIARMTLEEKAGQLTMLSHAAAGAIANPLSHMQGGAEQLQAIRAGRVGALFNGAGVARKRAAQEAAVNGSRLGIPLLFGADVIHGFRTVFPVPLAEAASWHPELAERSARAAAVEATADGFRWTFAPMVDIARDARWGRGGEGAGEDVLLSRLFAAARVRGFQGRDLADADAMLATPKHFAAYGAAEGGLDYASADVSERSLREVYLPPFRAAIDAGALSLMSAFNDIAGVPANANAALLTGVLRDEWRYAGIVISDYTADEELMVHGLAAAARAATRLSFLAGVDMSMQSGFYLKHLPALVAAGEIPLPRLDASVRCVLRVKKRLGLFDQPMRGLDGPGDAGSAAASAHRQLARQAARESIVMLKNEADLLPLRRRGTRIALIGPFAEGPGNLYGPWSLFPGREPPVDIAQGVRAALEDPHQLMVVRGSDIVAPLRGGIAAAVETARAADVVLLAIGESDTMSGEARSRTLVEIPAAQRALADAVAAVGKPIVVLLKNGRALALEGTVRDAPCILVTWFLGAMTGPAIADVLFGDFNPCGRLPVSFPQTPGQVPLYYAHRNTGRPLPAGDRHADYKARFVDATREPLYAFGHGIGFSAIRYDKVSLTPEHLPWQGKLEVSARLTNTGQHAAIEVVQLYLHDRVASVVQPVRKLVAFQRVAIAPGESVDVRFALQRGDLAFVGPDLKETVEAGEFELWLGPSAATGMRSLFTLLGP